MKKSKLKQTLRYMVLFVAFALMAGFNLACSTTTVTEKSAVEEKSIEEEIIEEPVVEDEEIEAVEEPEEEVIPAAVSLTDEGNYYMVVLDYTTGKNPYEIMQEYGQKLSDELPDIQRDIDQYLYDTIDAGMEMFTEDMGIEVPKGFNSMAIGFISQEFMQRVEEIKPQLPQDYITELDGLASTLTNTDASKIGDGLLSRDELYFWHLMADVARVNQCSAIGVFGPLSETGSTMVGRNFDMDVGFPGYGSITKINKGNNSVYLVGWLANLNAYTAFNDDGVFGALVDTTGIGQPYSSSGKYSYAFDLRYALENENTLEGAADYMSQHPYGFNHLIFLADAEKSQVLENNLDGTGSNIRRALRSSDSELNPGIVWDFDNVIVAVSAFMLEGNHDNFTDAIVATSRLKSYKALLTEAEGDGKVTWDEVKSIQSYDGTDGIPSEMEFGDLYNIGTRRIVLFKPETFKLEVFFSQTPGPPDDPIPFDIIPISFDQ